MQWIAPSKRDAGTVNLCHMNFAVHYLKGDILAISPTSQKCIESIIVWLKKSDESAIVRANVSHHP